MSPQFLENLSYLMNVYGIKSIHELSKQIGLPQPTLHHIFKGTTKKPRERILKTLAAFFDVSIKQLCGHEPLPRLVPEYLQKQLSIKLVPLLSLEEAALWSLSLRKFQKGRGKNVIIENNLDEFIFALNMDVEMGEPFIMKGATLFFSVDRQVKDKDLIAIFLHEKDKVCLARIITTEDLTLFVREINEASPEEAIFRPLHPKDRVLGVLIECRTSLSELFPNTKT